MAQTVTPYFDDGGGRVIYHADNRDLIPALDFDAAFTSPPYNLGAVSGAYANNVNAYDDHDDAMPEPLYAEWQREVLTAMWERLPAGGAIFYNHKVVIRDGVALLPTRLIPDVATIRQVVTWDRGGGFNWSPSFFVPRGEWIVILARAGFRLADRGASNAGDVWRIPIEQDGEGGHPCAFPLGLPKAAMVATDDSLVWLDPFMGGGTTLRAAKDLGRRAIGVEVSERYCEIAAKRLGQEVLALGGAA